MTCTKVNETLPSGGNLFQNASVLPPCTISAAENQPTVSPEFYYSFDNAGKQFCYVFYGLIFVLGVSGNALVFFVIGYRKKKKTSCDLLILALAFADFLASIFAPMVMLNDLITDGAYWFYGEALCHVLPALPSIFLSASAWSLVLIACDRYRVIARPMARRKCALQSFSSLFLIWTLSVGINIPYYLTLELAGNICQPSNDKITNTSFAFVVIWITGTWCIPNAILVIVYCLTTAALKKSTLKHANNRAMEQRNKQNAKVVKMFVIIIVLFFILTMPYALFYFIISYKLSYGPKPDYKLMTALNYMLFALASANVFVNPLVYAKMNREINRFLRPLAQCNPRLFRFFGFNRRNTSNDPSTIPNVFTVTSNSRNP